MAIRKKICLMIFVLLFVPLVSPKPTLAETGPAYYYEDIIVNLYRDNARISASFDSNELLIPGFDPQIKALYEMKGLHIYFSSGQYSAESGGAPGPILGAWSEVTYPSMSEDDAELRAKIINYLIEQQFGVKLRIHGNTKETSGRLTITSYNVTTVDYFTVLSVFREILPEKSFATLFTDELIEGAYFSRIHLYLRPKSGEIPNLRSFIEITCTLENATPFIQGKYLFDLGEIMHVNDKIFRYEGSDRSTISIFFPGKVVEEEIQPNHPVTISENFYKFTFPEKITWTLYVKANYTMKKFPCLRATKTVNQYLAEPGDQIIVETMIENVGMDIAYDVKINIQIPMGGKLHSNFTRENSWKKILPGNSVTYSYIVKLPERRAHILFEPDQVMYASTNKSKDQTKETLYTNEVMVSTRSNAPVLFVVKESEKSVIDNVSTTIKISIKNVGNEEISDIEISEDIWYGILTRMPENSTIRGTVLTTSLPKLSPGESATIEYVVAVQHDAITHATLSYSSTTGEFFIKSNEIVLKLGQTLRNELTWNYQFKVNKRAFPATVMPGQTVWVSVCVTNLGNAPTPSFNVIDHVPSSIGSKDTEWKNLHLGPRESITLNYTLKIPWEYHMEGYQLPPVEVYSKDYRTIYAVSNSLHLKQNVLIHSWVLAGIALALVVLIVEWIYMRRRYIIVKI